MLGLGPLSSQAIAEAASNISAPALDGSATGTHSGSNTCSATLTTSSANDIIIALCVCELGTGAPAVTSVSGGGLTWTKRKAVTAGTSNSTSTELWWAVAPSALSAVAITANYASNFDDACLIVFGVSGCNTSSPWDPNASVPATSATNGTAAPTFTGISTTNADDFLIIGWGAETSGSSTAVPSGWTNIATSNNFGGSQFSASGVAYERVSATQSSATFTWGGTITGNPAAIFDALTADAAAITMRGTPTTANASTSSATATIPTGTTTGDVTFIASVQGATAGTVANTATVPTGWTAVMNVPGCLVAYRAWQSGDPSTVSIAWSGTNWTTTSAISYSNCDTSNPVDQSNFCVHVDQDAVSTPPFRAPSLTPAYANGQLLCVYGYDTTASGATITLPGGLTSRSASTAGPSLTFADKAITVPTSPTGVQDATALNTAGFPHFGCAIALKGSGAATTTQAANLINTAAVLQSTSSSKSSPVSLFSLAALGVQTNDLILLEVFSQATVTGPTGWTQMQSSSDGKLFSHVQAAGDTATPQFTLGSTAATSYTVAILRGARSATVPVVDTSGVNTATSSTTVSSSSLTPTTTSDFLALFAGSSSSNTGTWSVSAGPTRDEFNSSGPTSAFAWEQPAANPSGSFTWTTSGTAPATSTTFTVLAELVAPGVPLTGDHATSKAGSLAPSISIGLSGNHATSKAGTLTPSASIALTGEHATSKAGTLAVSTSSNITLTGAQATSKAGATIPSATVALTGEHATSKAGTVAPSATVALTGEHATSKAGTVVAVNGITLPLTGNHATSNAGTVGLTANVGLAGEHAASKAGTAVSDTTVGLNGEHATGKAGSVAPSTSSTVVLTGDHATAKAGTVAAITGQVNALTGNRATAKAGTIVAQITALTIQLAGQRATATARAPGCTNAPAPSRAAATARAHTLNAATAVGVSGQHATAQQHATTPGISVYAGGQHAVASGRRIGVDLSPTLRGDSAVAKAAVLTPITQLIGQKASAGQHAPGVDLIIALGGVRATARVGKFALGNPLAGQAVLVATPQLATLQRTAAPVRLTLTAAPDALLRTQPATTFTTKGS